MGETQKFYFLIYSSSSIIPYLVCPDKLSGYLTVPRVHLEINNLHPHSLSCLVFEHCMSCWELKRRLNWSLFHKNCRGLSGNGTVWDKVPIVVVRSEWEVSVVWPLRTQQSVTVSDSSVVYNHSGISTLRSTWREVRLFVTDSIDGSIGHLDQWPVTSWTLLKHHDRPLFPL